MLTGKWWFWALILALLVIFLYGGAYGLGFAWDDRYLVLTNMGIRDLSQFTDHFSKTLWADTSSSLKQSAYYRPLMSLSLAVDYALFELNAGGYHLHNLLWHLINTALVFLLIRGLLPWQNALIGAAIFALHPIQSETVLFIAARNDSMVLAFALAALILLRPLTQSAPRLLLGGFFALASLLSKEQGLLTLPVLMLFDAQAFWEARKKGESLPWATLLMRYGALAVALLTWLGLRQNAITGAQSGVPLSRITFLLSQGLDVAGSYAKMLFLPIPLTTGRYLGYILEQPVELLAFVLLFLAFTALAMRRGGALAAVGALWVLGALVPTLMGIAGSLLIADRYLYFSMAGFALMVAVLVGPGAKSGRKVLLAAVPLILLFSLQITNRVPAWKNSLTLAASVAQDYPSPYAYHFLAGEMASLEAFDESVPWVFKAMEGEPLFVPACTDVVKFPLLAGDREKIQQGLDLATRRGCPYSAKSAASYILAQGVLGQMEKAWQIVGQMKGQAPEELIHAIAGSLLLLEGRDEAYARAKAGSGLPQYDRRVASVLSKAGLDDLIQKHNLLGP